MNNAILMDDPYWLFDVVLLVFFVIIIILELKNTEPIHGEPNEVISYETVVSNKWETRDESTGSMGKKTILWKHFY